MSASASRFLGSSRQARGALRCALALAVVLTLGAFGAVGAAAAAAGSTVEPADLRCFGAAATIVGTPGDDHIRGTSGVDVIVSGRGADQINGRGGDDLICGRSGNDTIRGGAGDDRVRGWRGKDRIAGGSGDDRLLGGPDTDKLLGGGDDDSIDGGTARDECDGQAGTNTLLHCEVTPNEPPAAVDDSATTDEDSTRAVPVLANDSDPDGDSMSVSSVATTGTRGTVTVTGGGTGVSYDPRGQFNALAPGASGTDSFTYTVSDGQGGTDVAAVTVTVTGTDDAPAAVADSKTVAEDASATTIDVRANDTDVDGGPKTIGSVTQPVHGTVVITNGGDDLTYAPTADYCNTPPPSDDFTYTLNGGSTATVHVTVTCVDDAPVVDLNGAGGGGANATASFTEDSGPVLVASAAEVADVDDADLVSATLTLTNRPDGVTESLSVDTTGTSITAGSYDSATGVLTLSGSDTVAHYQQVIRSLSYANSSDTPATADRLVDVKVNDGTLDSNQPHSTVSVSVHNDAPHATDQSGLSTDEETPLPVTLAGTDPEGDTLTFAHDAASVHGGTVTGAGTSVTYTPAADYCGPDSFDFTVDDGNGGADTGTVTVAVTCVDDAPVVDLNGAGGGGANATASFTEDSGPVLVASAAEVADVDDADLVSATLTLTNRPDGVTESLSVDTTGTSITAGSYDSATGVLTLSGSDTVAHYQQVIRSLSYANSSDTPATADRLVDVKVNDGTLDSNQPHSTVSVSVHNDAPHATDQSGLSTDEETPLPVTLAGTDPEGDTLTFAHDAASVHGGTVTGAGTSVTYTPAADYCGPDSFDFTVDDGNGGADTGTVTVAVTCVDDAPVVDLNGAAPGNGNSVLFSEQATHTGGDVLLAADGTITDVDDTGLESLTVTLGNHPDGSAEVLTADTTGTSITADAYNATTGVLLLHGTDTKAHYQQVLRTIGYRNDAAPPNAATRNVSFVASDGDTDSVSRTTTVSVVPLNVPPILDLNSTAFPGLDTTASFAEDAGPTILAPTTDLADADNANLQSATVTLTTRPDSGAESLSADVTGTSITADAYDPATGVLLLHGSDTQAHYQQVVRTIAYDNSSDTPAITNRSVTVVVNDGQSDSNTATVTVSMAGANDAPTATDQSVSTNEDTPKQVTLSGTDPDNDSLTYTFDPSSAHGVITGPAPTVTYTPAADYCGPDSFAFTADDGHGGTDQGTISITVACVNDAPVSDLNVGAGIDNTASFTEDQPAVTLAPSAVVSDVDNANLASATVVLTNHPDGSAEGLTAVTAGTSITADAYNATTGVLLLHGSDTIAHYQQVLRSVTYDNTSNTPDTTARTLSWTVNDGSLDSPAATTTLSVSAANDAPTLDLNGAGAGVDGTASYTEDQPATTLAPSAVAADPDNADLQSATVTLTNHPDGVAESLSVDTSGTSITGAAYNSGTGVLALSGSDTVADYQQVLRTITYVNTSQNAAPADRVVTFVVHDGAAGSNSPKVTVTITVVNDPPVVDLNGGGAGIDSSAAFVEDSSPNVVGSGPVTLGASATVSDVDNASLATATLTITNRPDGAAESLSVSLAGSPHITTGGYNSATGVLTLTGGALATPAEFQAAVRSVTYNNTSNTPNPADRDVTIKVNDGAADSTVAHTTVSVTPTNDAPLAVDETFNAANGAVGNTTLNVNATNNHGGAADGRPATPDPTDTSPVADRPHKEITGDILANDTDPEQAGSALTVTPGTFATNDGGSVTIQADGDFNFEPAASISCTDASDFFDYTVTDNAGTNTGSDTGRVTIPLTGCVWYVNNNDAQGNSGTSEKPFDTLAQAQTASGNGQSIFVYDGDDTTLGYTAGITLKTNQQLLSEAATLTIGPDTLHAADAANKASLTNINADVVTMASGTTVRGFNVDPQGTGGGIFGTGFANLSTNTIADVQVTDTATKGAQPGLELDSNNAGATTNISNLTVNNGDGSSATTTDEGVKVNAAGTVNFASSGTISITTNGARGLDATAGAGTTNLGTASIFDDITVTNSGNGGVFLQGTTGSDTWLGDGSGTDLNLTTVSGTQPALSIQSSGTVNVLSGGIADLHATGGPAADIVSPGGPGSSFSFDDVDSLNSATDGVNLDSLGAATFSATTGDIGGEAGIGFDLNGGSGAITYGTFNSCSFANGSGPLVAEVTGRTGGVVSIPCNMIDTNDAGGGINEAGNTGGSTVYSGAIKQFNTGASDAITVSNPDGSTHTAVWSGGGTDIDTTSGNGVNVTGVGPVADGNVQFSLSGNTIDSTSLAAGKRALNISDVNVTGTGNIWDHISSSGGANGIRLNNAGGTVKAITVTGTGGAPSGGTITGASGSGISLTNVNTAAAAGGGVAFDGINVTANTDDGINAATVNNFDVTDSTLTNNGDAATGHAGGTEDRGFDLLNVTGTDTILRTTASGSQDSNAHIRQTVAGTATWTVNQSTFTNSKFNAGLRFRGEGSSTLNTTVTNSTFSLNADPGFSVSTDSANTAHQTVLFDNNSVSGGSSNAVSGRPEISINTDSGSVGKVTISNNHIKSAAGSEIIINSLAGQTAAGSLDAKVIGNTINDAQSGSPDALADAGVGIFGWAHGDGATRIEVTNNTVQNWGINALQLGHNDGNGSADFTVSGNTFSTPDTGPNHFEGMYVYAGGAGGDQSNVCVDMKNNDLDGIAGGGVGFKDLAIDHFDVATSQLRFIGNNTTSVPSLESALRGRNSASPALTVESYSGGPTATAAASCNPTVGTP